MRRDFYPKQGRQGRNIGYIPTEDNEVLGENSKHIYLVFADAWHKGQKELLMKDDNLEPNEIYFAFENYEDGLFAYFDSYDEAEDWAFTRQAENNKKFSREEQHIMIDNYENTIFVDIIGIDNDGVHHIIETVLDIGLF